MPAKKQSKFPTFGTSQPRYDLPHDLAMGVANFSWTVSLAPDFPALIEVIGHEITALLQAKTASLWFLNEDRVSLSLGYSAGNLDLHSLPVHEASIEEALRIRRPTEMLGDNQLKPFLDHHTLVLPLVTGLRKLGVLIVSRPEPFTADWQEAAAAAARQTSYALTTASHVSKLADSFRRDSQQLADERRQLAAVVAGTAEGIITLDQRGRIEMFNPAMGRITGYRSSAVRGQRAQDIFKPRTEQDQPFDFSQLQDEQRHDKLTISIATREDTSRWVDVSAAPAGVKGGEGHTVFVFRDITDQYEFMRRQTEFVSIASHELRTPITALLGFLALTKTPDTTAEQQRHFLDRAEGAASRLAELVEDLLSVARIEENRLSLTPVELHPHDIMSETVDNLRHVAARKNIEMYYENSLPEAQCIDADRSKLQQVFSNLVDNAIKYTPDGGRVTVTVAGGGGQAVITVTDTGIGISEANLERVFEKFFREYTDLSIAAGGTGLGLFITKELVERQDGVLELTSQTGRGTTATVRFALAA